MFRKKELGFIQPRLRRQQQPAPSAQPAQGPTPQPRHAKTSTGVPRSVLTLSKIDKRLRESLDTGEISVAEYTRARQLYRPNQAGNLPAPTARPTQVPTATPTPTPAVTATATQMPTSTSTQIPPTAAQAPKPTQPPIVRTSEPTSIPTSLPPDFDILTPTQQQAAYNFALEGRRIALQVIRPEYQQYFANVPFVVGMPGPYAGQATPAPPVTGNYWPAKDYPDFGPTVSLYGDELASSAETPRLLAISLHELMHHWEFTQGVPEDFYAQPAVMVKAPYWTKIELYAYLGMFPDQIPPELQRFYPMYFGAQP